MKSVDVVDVFLSLINLALNPVPIEVSEQMIIVGACGRVSVPLLDVKCEKGLVGMLDHLGVDAFEVLFEVVVEAFVEIFSEKVCWMRVSVIDQVGTVD